MLSGRAGGRDRQSATVESALPPFTWTSKADQILTKLKGVKHLSNRPLRASPPATWR
jgi:hypothetical protein